MKHNKTKQLLTIFQSCLGPYDWRDLLSRFDDEDELEELNESWDVELPEIQRLVTWWSTTPILEEIFSDLISGISDAAKKHGFAIPEVFVDWDFERKASFIRELYDCRWPNFDLEYFIENQIPNDSIFEDETFSEILETWWKSGRIEKAFNASEAKLKPILKSISFK